MSTSDQLLRKYIYEFYKALNCPRSLTAWLLYSHGEHKQLVELDFNPLHYNAVNEAEDSLAATKFLSKATFLSTGIDTKAAALKNFFAAEEQCRLTNQRIARCEFENPHTVSLLLAMAHKASQILGNIDIEAFLNDSDWGPGATTRIPRRNSTKPKKYLIESSITANAYDFVKDFFSEAYPLWDRTFCVGASSKIVTVPKNAKTDRTIAIEPGINLWFQKGIGAQLRRKLRRIGIDLNKQSINAERSRIAAKYNHLATVDFSSASDTISSRLVEEILPRDWFLLLRAFRSSSGVCDGMPVVFEKFSSMGNGYTFELESLIFYLLAVCVCEQLGIKPEVSVYGDDVILPSAAFDVFVSASRDLGFTVNTAKSYSSTYFRESCGSYWWAGRDIKPIFQKENLDDKMAIVKAANSVRRLAHRRNTYGCDRRLRRCWSLLAGSLGNKAPRISEGYGDTGLIENIDGPYVSAVRAKHGIEGFFCPVWATISIRKYIDHQGLYLFRLRSIGESSDSAASGNFISTPSRTRLARKRMLVPRWYDLGPWI